MAWYSLYKWFISFRKLPYVNIINWYRRFLYEEWFNSLTEEEQEKEKAKYVELVAKLDAYSPLKTLSRGYSITQKDGKVIRSQTELKSGDVVGLRFVDGQIEAKVQ